jgi:hypothetical protein
MPDASVAYADMDDMPRTSRTLGAHQCPMELGISAQTVRQWASRGVVVDGERRKLRARSLDGSGRPLYFEHELLALRDAQRDSAVQRVTVAQETVTLSHSAHSTRVPKDRVLSSVRGQGGVVPDQTPPKIVVPVELDTSKAEQQLDEFCNLIARRVGSAVANAMAAAMQDPDRS